MAITGPLPGVGVETVDVTDVVIPHHHGLGQFASPGWR
jgi:hypothetical protein